MPFADDAGMLPEHVAATIRVAQADNTFIFVRPTTLDSRRLIGFGYPTKSMDIHDKSSDWGPMAGFVPVNPAFDKKRGLSQGRAAFSVPNPALDRHNDHGLATTCQLFLTDELLVEFEQLGKITRVPGRWARPHAGETHELSGAATPADARHYRATKDTIVRDFYLWRGDRGWLVWYEDTTSWATGDDGGVAVEPLNVWAYMVGDHAEPVTGDYDLWMVAPYRTSVRTHLRVELNADLHGPSAATTYITGAIRRLNTECACLERAVYRHGAESQNYTFTQGIDARLAMFTPNGTARMVARGDLPAILTDVRNHGYLVYANKRYLETDPMIMDKPSAIGRDRLDALRRKLSTGANASVKWANRPAAGMTPHAKFKLAAQTVGKTGVAHNAATLLPSDETDIAKFATELVALLRMRPDRFNALSPADFPQALSDRDRETRVLRRALESLVVDSSAVAKDRLNAFVMKNIDELLSLLH